MIVLLYIASLWAWWNFLWLVRSICVIQTRVLLLYIGFGMTVLPGWGGREKWHRVDRNPHVVRIILTVVESAILCFCLIVAFLLRKIGVMIWIIEIRAENFSASLIEIAFSHIKSTYWFINLLPIRLIRGWIRDSVLVCGTKRFPSGHLFLSF